MHLPQLIHDLAVILGVAAIVALTFQKIRQPIVVGYIIAGLIVGPHTPTAVFVRDLDSIRTWAELGVIFLMFSLGLEFSFRKLFHVGPSASITALLEVVFMSALGYGTSRLLGWSSMDGLYLGAMLAISSTTIIIKALDELKLKSRRFAELVFAVLIVEDLLAILLLVVLTAIAQQGSVSGMSLLSSGAKLILITGSWFLVGYFLVPRLVKSVAKTGTPETLTILSLGLCLGLVVIAAHFEYSAALGAFIMGSIISESSESHRIEETLMPIRDLFAAIFFVSVGMLIDPTTIIEHWGAVLLITIVTILGKSFITILGAIVTGQPTSTAVQVGFSLSQIGEFSFIIAGLGMSLGVVSKQLYPIGVAVSLITTFTTPYLIRISERVGRRAEAAIPPRLRRFQEEMFKMTQERRGDPKSRKLFYRSLFRWGASGILVTLVFVLVAENLQQFLPKRWMGWVASCVLSGPFIWSMLTAFRVRAGFKTRVAMTRSFVALLFNFVTILWVGTLSAKFFPIGYALISTFFIALGVLVAFRRTLEVSYNWFERRFLDTFEMNLQESHPEQDTLLQLAPWNAHLVKIRIHPNSPLVGKSLAQAELRTRHGVNIVVIQRGRRSIVAPPPTELFYPHDELLTLGTDAQIDQAKSLAEAFTPAPEAESTVSGYELRPIRITDGSAFVGQTIRSSQIRSRYLSMVVGIERDGARISNPDSDLAIQRGDLLWVVGSKASLNDLRNV